MSSWACGSARCSASRSDGGVPSKSTPIREAPAAFLDNGYESLEWVPWPAARLNNGAQPLHPFRYVGHRLARHKPVVPGDAYVLDPGACSIQGPDRLEYQARFAFNREEGYVALGQIG